METSSIPEMIGGGAVGVLLTLLVVVACAWWREHGAHGVARPTLQNYEAISEGELLERLLGAPGSPVYLAVRAVIDEERLALVNDALEEGLTTEVLRHRLGGVDALTELTATLEERITEARERHAKIEEEKEEAKTA